MKSLEKNEIYKRTYSFAIDVIKIYRELKENNNEYALFEQFLRSGTSIGANTREALAGQSKRDFIAKLSIALKEANETDYWLKLFVDSDILDEKRVEDYLEKLKIIIKMITKIINTTKRNMKR